MTRSLVVKVTVGAERLEALSQALTVATTALASAVPVSVWLTGESTHLATPGFAERLTLPHSAAFADLRDALVQAKAVTVCTQCAARRGLEPEDLVPGIRIGGAAALVDRSGGSASLDVPFAALLAVDLPTWDPASCPLCAQGLPIVKPGSRTPSVS